MSAVRFESASQPGLFFWAERESMKNGTDYFVIYAQAEGGEKTEAFDDWLCDEGEAQNIARQLASGDL